MNIASITGRLTKDIELRITGSGVEYAKFDVAVKRPFKTAAGEKTDFIHCTAWRQSARFLADYAHKGDTVALVGAFQNDRYTDKNGNDKDWWNLNVDRAELVGTKNSQNGGSGQKTGPARAANPVPAPAVLDDIAPGELGAFDDQELPF